MLAELVKSTGCPKRLVDGRASYTVIYTLTLVAAEINWFWGNRSPSLKIRMITATITGSLFVFKCFCCIFVVVLFWFCCCSL